MLERLCRDIGLVWGIKKRNLAENGTMVGVCAGLRGTLKRFNFWFRGKFVNFCGVLTLSSISLEQEVCQI